MRPPAGGSTPVKAPAAAVPAAGSGPLARLGITRLGEARHLGLVIALVLLAVVGLVTVPETFATASNLVSILSLAATIGVITVGMTFVIIGGGSTCRSAR